MTTVINWMQRSTVALAVVLALMAPALLPAVAGAQIPGGSKDAACEGIGADNCNTGTTGAAISSLLGRVVNILSWAVGIVSVIMIIVGGFKFIVSAGDANGIKSARNTIIYAIVGLVFALLAQVLVRFVIREAI